MKYAKLLFLAFAMMVLFASQVSADPNYIYAMHDSGGEQNMADMGKKGWIVFSEEIGCNPSNYAGKDYSGWTNAGYGCIVRLNNGYGSTGTLPVQSQYANFAQRVANYVANSPGCRIWIIGNETNLPREWPGNIDGNPATGEPITVARYTDAFNRCANAIKALSGHASDQIIPSPVGTWGPPYPAQGIEGFDDYWVNECNACASKATGLAVHAYTHGTTPSLVFDESLMGAPYEDIHYNFRVYKDLMNRIPTGMRSLPCYLTETDENGAWLDSNTGWVRNVYSEINSWNQTAGTQKIRCVALFRWVHAGEGDQYYICDRGGVIQDWRDSMTYGYVWNTAVTQNDANSGTDAGATTGTAIPINTGSYSGSFPTTSDTNDYYSFSVTSGQIISCSMTPPSGQDFDIYLYNSSGTQKAISSNGAGLTDSFTFTADSTGTWYFRVYRYSGTGNYTFSVNVSNPGVSMNNNTPTGTNVAPQSTTVQADTYYGGGFEGNKAIDSTTSSKWCSTSAASTHTIALDLGSDKTVTGYILKLASTGGEGTEVNLKNFKIQTASSLSGPWSDETTVDNTAQAATITRSYTTPKTVRYVRLYITNCGIDNYARLPEFEVYSSGSGQSSTMNNNTPTGSNVAPQSTTVQTDTDYSSSFNGPKAIDSSTSSKWCSTNAASTHTIALDLGSTKTVNGYILRLGSTGGDSTTMNLKNFKIQTASSLSGPWTDDATVDNTAQAGVITRSYDSPKSVRYVRLYITNCGIDNYARLPEFEVYSGTGGSSSTSEDFNSMPAWNTSFEASWGSAATWSIVGGGQSGSCLEATRGSQGSSAKVMVYNVTANTTYTVSVYIKCPSYTSGTYWAETAVKLGNNSASDFDSNASSWTMIKKFDNAGTNGNNNTWTQYSVQINTGSNTQISVGYKHGASSCAGPTVAWDTLRIQ